MKRFFLLALYSVLNLAGYAYDFELEGMYFNIISASDRTVSLTYKDVNYNSYSGDVVIPGTVIYNNIEFTIENVDYNTFRECTNLKSITLPKGLKNFGTINEDWMIGGFYNTSVWDLYVPDMETFLNLNIAQSANPFNPKGSLYIDGVLLEEAVIPEGILKIRYDCFAGCKSLKTVKFSSSVQIIESQAFMDCTNLESVLLNDEITTIGVNAFSECTNLKEINIPQKLRLLGDGGNGSVFDNCQSLESPMNFPEGIETIPVSMFAGCKNLKEVILPSTLKKIYWYAFYGCTSLKSITSNAENPPQCKEVETGGSTIFTGVDKFNCIVKCPTGSKNLYSQAEGWKQFFSIIEDNEPDLPITLKCSTPTIKYNNGILYLTCETDGVIFHTTIITPDNKDCIGNVLYLTLTYYVRVYATKDGYEDSDVATFEINLLDDVKKGDMNNDGVINVSDIMNIVNLILGQK